MVKYDASSIQVLEDMEHIRLRPNMYVGSQDSNGVRMLSKEVVDNSIDEWLAGHATEVSVVIDTSAHTFTITDNGRGIPVEKHEKTGLSTLTTVLTSLKAGGKFNKGAYAVSAGLHGVGMKATNALSTWLVARVWRKGYCSEQRFERGKPTTDVFNNKSLNERGRHGTQISFCPDTKIFGKHMIAVADVRTWLEESAHLCPGLRITLTIDGQTDVFDSSGLFALLNARAAAAGAKAMHIPISYSPEGATVFASFLWTEESAEGESAGEHWWSYCNASCTPEGGKHIDGAIKAISDVLKPFGKKGDIDVRDLTDGLYAAVHVLVAEPQFKGQTKDKLMNPEMKDVVYDTLYPHLKAFFDSNKKIADQIVERATQLRKARDSYKKLRTAIAKTSPKRERGILPDKLVEAMKCKPEDRELFLVEGDSAGGCHAEETMISLADGRTITIQQVAEEHEAGVSNSTYSYNLADGKVEVTRILNAWKTKKAKVIRIELDNGEIIRATPEHRYMLRTGEYKEARHLDQWDSLMPIGPRSYALANRNWIGNLGTKIANTFPRLLSLLMAWFPSIWADVTPKRSVVCVTLSTHIADVYDIEVEKHENFALGAGVFVHNSCKSARDPDCQEILPLRGKIANAVQKVGAAFLENEEISSIITAIGARIISKGKVDLSDIRIGKVILLADADPDGQHITSLLLAFFAVWMPDFVKSNRLYIVDSPLFVGSYKDSRFYAHSMEELMTKAGNLASKLQVSRLKGHGQSSSEEVKHYAMHSDTRKMWQVSMGENDQEIIMSLMGTDSTTRKVLLGLNVEA